MVVRQPRPSLIERNNIDINEATIKAFMPKFLGQNALLLCNLISLVIYLLTLPDGDHEYVKIQLVLVIYLGLISMVMGYLIWKKDRIRPQIMTNLVKAEFISTFIFAVGINFWIRLPLNKNTYGDNFFT